MFKTFEFEYVERDVIPPHCRKPRDIWGNKGSVTVEIKEIERADFMVAITLHNPELNAVQYYHFYDGRLWMRAGTYPQYSTVSRKKELFDLETWAGYNTRPHFANYFTRETNELEAKNWANEYLISAGMLYWQVAEPCYVIQHYANETYVSADDYNLSNLLYAYPITALDAALASVSGLRTQPTPPNCTFEVWTPEALCFLQSEEAQTELQHQIDSRQAAVDSLLHRIEDLQEGIGQEQAAIAQIQAKMVAGER